MAISNLVELNVTGNDSINVNNYPDILNQKKIQYIVVDDPTIFPILSQLRFSMTNKFKVILSMGFSGINYYGLSKFQNLSAEFFGFDGFDMMLTREGATESRLSNEILTLISNIKSFNAIAEYRFTIFKNWEDYDEDYLNMVLGVLKKNPCTMIRPFASLEGLDPKYMVEVCNKIKKAVPYDIKMPASSSDVFFDSDLSRMVKRFDVDISNLDDIYSGYMSKREEVKSKKAVADDA